jgi:oxygen-independent coproporphyrinogen-3 oxidase
MTIGVYVSYPFCAQKCTYCNFASGVFSHELERKYLECLQLEIESAKWTDVPDTVYLGGGTPSQIDAERLYELLSRIPGRPWGEATIEAAPGTITREKATAWREAGINRVSLGVQSFVGRELARTGRKHTAELVEREVRILRAAGPSNINIDLIAGLPGQTAESWGLSLDWVCAIAPPHVSVYMLEVDGESRLGQEVLLNGRRYGAPDVPSDEAIANFYETAVARLREAGIRRYEISNFARPDSESIHNLKYWRLEPYQGFGSDAHSFDGSLRWHNIDSPQEYVASMLVHGSARAGSDPVHLAEEKFFVGLRLSEGVTPEPDEWSRWKEPILRFEQEGLLERAGNRLRLTEQGVLYSNEVFAEFVQA